jgi:glycosyltransferase involved in cell wall biosynthesis
MGASDLFLHPGEDEPWGLVINEAVAARIPAIVSNRCGAAEDLIVPDRTGEIVPVGDLPAWVSAASKWLARLSRGQEGDVQEMVNRADAHSIQRAAAMIEDVVLTLQTQHE